LERSEWGIGIGNCGKIGVGVGIGVGLFTFDSAILVCSRKFHKPELIVEKRVGVEVLSTT